MGIFGKGICCGLYASIIFAGFCCMEVRLTWWQSVHGKVVLSLYNYLRSVFRRLSVERCTEYVATRRGYYRTKKFKRNYIKSYLLGCCTGLRKQFESIRKTAEETGLMLCHNHLIDDYFQSIGTTTHKSKNRNKVNTSAYCSGYDDGSKINLNKQINGK